MSAGTTRCQQCGMTFRLGPPPQPSRLQGNPNYICPEDGCARRFWCSSGCGTADTIAYTPRDHDERFSKGVPLRPAFEWPDA